MICVPRNRNSSNSGGSSERVRRGPRGGTERIRAVVAGVRRARNPVAARRAAASLRVDDQPAVHLRLGGAVPRGVPFLRAMEAPPSRAGAGFAAGIRCRRDRAGIPPVSRTAHAGIRAGLASARLGDGRDLRRDHAGRGLFCRRPGMAAALCIFGRVFPRRRAVAGAAGAAARAIAHALGHADLRRGAQLGRHSRDSERQRDPDRHGQGWR